jgi:hypothetical protein
MVGMHTDPKRDAQKVEDAGLLGVPEEAPSKIPTKPLPPQAPVTQPRPSLQDRLDLERSAGEGMVPHSNP